jgi:hypothetical protein
MADIPITVSGDRKVPKFITIEKKSGVHKEPIDLDATPLEILLETSGGNNCGPFPLPPTATWKVTIRKQGT